MDQKTDVRDPDEKVVEIEMERLRAFPNHPFKVIGDSQMIELQDSIKKYGVLNPLIVRPKIEGYYEIISGHRRKYAAEKLGYKKIPVIIRMLQDDEAVVIMVDPLSEINNHFMEKYYASLLKMPAVKSTRNMDGDKMITAATVHQIHKVLRSCFRQAVKWEMMDKNPAIDATLPKYKAEEREIWTAEMLMQAIDACENKWLKVAFHLAFAATVRIGELLGLTWDCVDVSEEAIAENRAYIFINKQVERVSRNAVDELDSKEVILIFPSQRKNNKTVRLLKTPKTDTSVRKVYIPKFVAQILVDIKKEQDELKDILGSEYQDYNLVMATTFGLPIGDSYLRDQVQKVIDEQGLPDVVFHSLRHTSVTYKLKLSGGDIKAVQGDSGHAQADMVTKVYGHIIDEDRRKNAQRMEDAFYNRENLNP